MLVCFGNGKISRPKQAPRCRLRKVRRRLRQQILLHRPNLRRKLRRPGNPRSHRSPVGRKETNAQKSRNSGRVEEWKTLRMTNARSDAWDDDVSAEAMAKAEHENEFSNSARSARLSRRDSRA